MGPIELVATGQTFPEPPVRARRYVEAIKILRELFDSERCTFTGEYYDVDIEFSSMGVPPPALVGAVAGPWTTKHITPLVDRVEVIPFPESSRQGKRIMTELAGTRVDDVRRRIDLIREVRPDVPVSLFVFVAVGDRAQTEPFADMFVGDLAAGLIGPPRKVAESLRNLASVGLQQVTLLPMIPSETEALAAALFAA